jgi:hypothetical protein
MLQQRNALIAFVFLLSILLAACSQAPDAQETGQTGVPAPRAYPYPQPNASSPLPPSNGIYPYPDSGATARTPPYPAPAYPAPWQPAAGDESMQRGNVYIDEQNILVTESFPPQFQLTLKGNLPTPCHQLRVQVDKPDQENRIQVEAYSLVKTDEICIQVLDPFQVHIPLKDLPPGKYTVWVNGEKAGQIENP